MASSNELEVVIDLSEPQAAVLTGRAAIIADLAGQGSGKTMNIGLDVGQKVIDYPKILGFIAANTFEQLSNSTLKQVFRVLETKYGFTEFHARDNPQGDYVQGKKPPRGWKMFEKFKAYNNIMSFRNGCTVFMGSLDNYMAHDGKEFGWAHLDETKDTAPDAVQTVILSRLRQRGLYTDGVDVFYDEKITNAQALAKGWRSWTPLYIHTSPGEGSVDWLVEMLGIAPYAQEIKEKIMSKYDFFCKEINGNLIVNYSSYHNEDNLSMNYISDRLSRYTEAQVLKYIYGYIFAKNGGEFFPKFDTLKHTGPVVYNKELALHTAWDFNVLPYVTCEVAQVEYIIRYWNAKEKKKYREPGEGREEMEVLQIRFLKEYCIGPPMNTTEQTAEAFAEDFAEYSPEVYVYGDASGRNRIEGLGSLTQYKIIEGSMGKHFNMFAGWMRVDKINTARMSRRDLVNRILEDKIPEVELLFSDTNCPQLVRDFSYVLQAKDGGKHKEKVKDVNGILYEAIGHTSDAAEYLICKLCNNFIKDFSVK